MDFIDYFLVLSVLITCFSVLTSNSRPSKLPPGPRPLPIIGNILHLITPNPHQSLAKLSKTYGPLMHLKLGCKDTIIVTSPEMAKQVLQIHDQVLSARPELILVQIQDHQRSSIIWRSSDSRWRVFRKVCKEHLFSQHRLESGETLRQAKLKNMFDFLHECSDSGRAVNIADTVFSISLDLISASLFSIELDSDTAQSFKETLLAILHNVGTPNLADYFPFLAWIDPQGLERREKVIFERLLRKLDEIIEKRLESDIGQAKNDFLGTLLEISRKNESEFSRNDILHLFTDLYIGATSTVATTVEWAMSELIRSPTIMAKAKMELHTLIGENAQMKELDISRLPYLQGVVKETLRLHPPAPLLVPHKAQADVEICGYTIPKNSELLVNLWAIARDPNVWPNPCVFEPERYLDSRIDLRGQDFELIPFGSGRRICPGLPLGYRMVHLVVASLIHSFDWKLKGGQKLEDLDMTEKFALSLDKAIALRAIPVKA